MHNYYIKKKINIIIAVKVQNKISSIINIILIPLLPLIILYSSNSIPVIIPEKKAIENYI